MNLFVQPVTWSSIAALMLCSFADAQIRRAEQENSALQQHYDAAQRLQQSGKNEDAVREYRVFLADAQEKLGAGYSVSGNPARAASLFEEALALEPNSIPLRMNTAGAALLSGDAIRARALARSILSDEPAANAQVRAQAHQILGRALLEQSQDRDAKAELESAVQLDPSFANRYDLALVCLDLDDGQCATEVFAGMERSFGDTPALHMRIGLAYGNSDFAPRAIAEFRTVIAEDARFPGAHYCLAAALLGIGDDQKNVPEAEAELKKELEISPHDALTYAALGKLAVAGHQTSDAENYLKTAIVLDPTNPDAYLYLGQLDFDAGRDAGAEAALRKSIELTRDPSRNRFQIQKAYYLLGRVLMQQHRAAEAHAKMELARTFANEDLSHDKRELAELLNNPEASGSSVSASGSASNPAVPAQSSTASSGLPGSAGLADLLAVEKRLAPAIADSYNNLGVIVAMGGQYAQALAYFDHAAEWNPGLGGLDLNRGRAAFMASQFSVAIPPLSRYVGAHPGDSGVRGALAMSQFMTHDYVDCIDTLNGVEDKLGSIPQMKYIFAESLVKTSKTAEGKRRLEELEAAHPEIADVHRALGEVFAEEHEPAKAAEELRMALVLNGADAQAHFDLGSLKMESGDAAEAIPELQAAVRLAPDESAFHRELAVAYRLTSRSRDAQKEADISERLANAARADQPGRHDDGSNR